MAEPEPAPAGIAEFVRTMPLQTGAPAYSLAPWMPSMSSAAYNSWPLAIREVRGSRPRRGAFAVNSAPMGTRNIADWYLSQRFPRLVLEVASPADLATVIQPAKTEEFVAPPRHELWMRPAAAEPAARFVHAAVEVRESLSAREPRFAQAIGQLLVPGVRLAPAACLNAIPAPAAEAAASFVQSAAAVSALLPAALTTQLPALHLEPEHEAAEEELTVVPAACESLMRSPLAEPVWAFVQPAAALETHLETALALPRLAATAPMQFALAGLLRDAQPEPVWSTVQPAAALAMMPAAVRLPSFDQQIDIMEDDLPMETPATCEVWMRGPQAEPVFTYVAAAVAGASQAALAARAPEVAALRSEHPYLPSPQQFRAVPQAEPVMAGVWPHTADIPFAPIETAAEIEMPWLGTRLRQDSAQPETQELAAVPAAEAAEAWISTHAAALPVAASAGSTLPVMAAETTNIGIAHAGPAAGPAPAALESLLAASAAGQIESATVVRLQPFAVAASEERTVPGFDAPRLAPPASRPGQQSPAKVAVSPVSTIRVAAPRFVAQEAAAGVPASGMMPLEFHAQRMRGGDISSHLDWRSVRWVPMAPRFAMRTVWDRSEEPVAPKPQPKKSTIAEVFTMAEAKPRQTKWIAYASRIAAGIVVMFGTWYTLGTLQQTRVITVRPNMAARSGGVSSAIGSAVASAASPKPQGTIARWKESISRRAALQIGDDLREGMQAWGAAAKTYPAGWARSAEGYTNTGALALFNPTKTFTDYRMEFSGEIEKKSIGWTVRAKDENNYHAMKFTVIEAGLRPVIAMVHYSVVNGKEGRRSQTPLNVMVHNRAPLQVAVNVKGNSFVTSIDGEQVDTYSDDTLASGGVGFFSEAGEKARLYWVKVSKNDDWLGHFCAFLSGTGAQATADLRAPEFPGTPSPWNPVDDRASLAGAWIALPYASCRKARAKSARC
jgi:hypothetical protein